MPAPQSRRSSLRCCVQGIGMVASFLTDAELDPQDLSRPEVLLATLRSLRQAVQTEGQATLQAWMPQIKRPEFLKSAENLAEYLALRRRDLRPLQTALMPWGLSSLGRIEGRVMANLNAVIATLEAVCHADGASLSRPTLESFFEGDRLLQANTEALFGKIPEHRRVSIMVTLPTEAATDADFVRILLERGANCVRINCAHDTPVEWQAMIDHVRRATVETGLSCKVYMDLGGPKPRTGEVVSLCDRKRVFVGDVIWLTEAAVDFESIMPTSLPTPLPAFQTCCSLPEILSQLSPSDSVWIDDGKIGATVVTPCPTPDGKQGVLLRVAHTHPEGRKLKPDKGLNFPDTVLNLSPLTDKDYQDLDFAATRADIIGYSFVQTAADIQQLQQALQVRLNGAPLPAIVAKIETPEAIRNLPELIVQAAGQQILGVMIARGDLAVEIGYQRLAEMQEEILWICEAAHIPVIWATQVLETLVKEGVPSRGEITDAAMAERAECVMLNKGPFVAEAVSILDDVLTRMQAHQLKKTPQLRALHSWL